MAIINVEDMDANIDSDVVETIDITVSSRADAGGITVTLTELAPNAGVFSFKNRLGSFNLCGPKPVQIAPFGPPSQG